MPFGALEGSFAPVRAHRSRERQLCRDPVSSVTEWQSVHGMQRPPTRLAQQTEESQGSQESHSLRRQAGASPAHAP